MNRRGFLGLLASALVAPKAIAAAKTPEAPKLSHEQFMAIWKRREREAFEATVKNWEHALELPRTVYVDFEHGDDRNDGFSEGHAKRTIQAAAKRTHTGSPDWILVCRVPRQKHGRRAIQRYPR